MGLFTDVQFLTEISYRLDKFSRKGDFLFNCRCPFCGDSKTNLNKARGFFFKAKDHLNYKCHNCGKSTTFAIVLKTLDPLTYKRYRKEEYVASNVQQLERSLPKIVKSKKRTEMEQRIDVRWPFLTPVSNLEDDHPAKQYLNERKIPEQYQSLFYFVEKTRFLNALSDKYDGRWKNDEPRIVIPFYNIDHKLVGFNCRALDKTIKMRYLMVKLEEEEELIFGLDRVDFSDDAYIVEGPFDSLFLPNAVAAGGTALEKVVKYFNEDKVTLVFDNQPRNPDVMKIMNRAIENGHRVCIWSSVVLEKDINDMILAGKSPEMIEDIIRMRTFQGLTAKVKFNEWRKTNE